MIKKLDIKAGFEPWTYKTEAHKKYFLCFNYIMLVFYFTIIGQMIKVRNLKRGSNPRLTTYRVL